MKDIENFLLENNLVIGSNLIEIEKIIVNDKIIDISILYIEHDEYVINYIDYSEKRFLMESDRRGEKYSLEKSKYSIDEAKKIFKDNNKWYQDIIWSESKP